MGRFINADGLLGANEDILSYNLFAYCSNNPICFADYDGERAGNILKSVWSIALFISQLDTAVPGICDAIALGFGIGATVLVGILVIPWDSIGDSISKGWNTVKGNVKSVSSSLSISKAVARVKAKIKKEKKKNNYWLAVNVGFGNGKDAYIPTIRLSYSEAIAYVQGGGSVFANSRRNAYKLARAVGGGKPIRHNAHGGIGFWKHYHATRGGLKMRGHIFYV